MIGWVLKIGGFFLGNWQRIAIYALVAVLTHGAAAGWGYMRGVQRLWDYQAEQARQAVKLVVRQAAATVKVITEYIQVAGKTEFVTRFVEKEVEVYVETHPDSRQLDARWGQLHDAAALNIVPGSPGQDHGTIGAPTAAEATTTTTQNYAACHRTADRLDACQAWIRGQKEANP
jgi:hypothetical protein